MNTIQKNQNKNKNTFKRIFEKHKLAVGTASIICLTTAAVNVGMYVGVKDSEEKLNYTTIEQENVKQNKTDVIVFKEPLRQGQYSTSDDLAHKMFGELELKTEIKLGDETYYLASVDKNRKNNKEKDELAIILVNKETGKHMILYENSFMQVKINEKIKSVSVKLDTIETKEGKKLNGIKVEYI